MATDDNDTTRSETSEIELHQEKSKEMGQDDQEKDFPESKHHSDSEEDDQIVALNKSKTKLRAVIDSDDDSSNPAFSEQNLNIPKHAVDSEGETSEEEENQISSSKTRRKRVAVFDSSDSENDRKESPTPSRKLSTSRKVASVADSSSDSDDELLDIGAAPPRHSDFDSDSGPVHKPPKISTLSLDPEIFGDDSSDDDSRPARVSSEEETEQKTNQKGTKQSSVPKRKASEKARMKTMQELASQTQKLMRESRVSLPYHKPQQLTLDEFLKKRKMAKAPVLTSLVQGKHADRLINVDEDVLPLVNEVEKEKERELMKMQVALETMNKSEQVKEPNTSELPLAVENSEKTTPGVQDILDDWSDDGDLSESKNESLHTNVDGNDSVKPATLMEEKAPESKIIEMHVDEGKSDLSGDEFHLTSLPETPKKSTSSDSVAMEVETDSNCNTSVAATEVNLNSLDNLNGDCVDKSLGNITDSVPNALGKDAMSNCTVGNEEKPKSPMLDTSAAVNQEQAASELNLDGGGLNADTALDTSSMEQTKEGDLKRQEDELDSYLQSRQLKLGSQRKKTSILERLKALPNYEKIISAKPRFGGKDFLRFNANDVIDLDSETAQKFKNPEGVEKLMDRMMKHSLVADSALQGSKPHHVTLHVSKTEKDSQGMLQPVVTEIDYVENKNEDDELVAICNGPQGNSPREALPGEKLNRLRQTLRQRIQEKKAKEYEEKIKLHAMYNEEADGEETTEEQNQDECILDNEDEDEMSDEDSEEEDDLEEILLGEKVFKEKKRKKSKFVDEEAVDEDESDNSDDDDSDSDSLDSLPVEDNEDDEGLADDDSEPQLRNEIAIEDSNTMGEEKQEHDFEDTEKSTNNNDAKENAIAQLIGDSVEINEDLTDLCSGKFPDPEASQPELPPETQCDAFEFNDDDDEMLVQMMDAVDRSQSFLEDTVDTHPSSAPVKTPSQGPSESKEIDDTSTPKSVGFTEQTNENVETPKVIRKNIRMRQLNSFFEEIAEEPEASLAENSLELIDQTDEVINENDGSSELNPDSHEVQNVNDGEDLSDGEEEEVGLVMQKRKRKRLQFSDDEEDTDKETETNNVTEGEDSEADNSEEEIDNAAESFDQPAELDEEEEEMEVIQHEEVAKKGLFGKDGRLRKKFYDREAELSGSELGSEDEDERGLNYYDVEDGDEEVFNEQKLRNEVERAHLKHLLDKDDREIRLLQEELLERGDLEDGKQRERKFRWHDVDDAWGDEARMGDSDAEYEEDDEEEIKRKAAEVERRKWLTENSELLESMEEDSQKLFDKTKFLKVRKSTMKKIESFVETSQSFILNESSNSVNDSCISSLVKSKPKINSQILFSTSSKEKSFGNLFEDSDITQTNSANTNKPTSHSQPDFISPLQSSKMKRGSFLNRGSPSLSRLADLTKGSESNNNVKGNSRNFVFSVVTPPDEGKAKAKTKLNKHSSFSQPPKKAVKLDRSFSNLDETSKDASVFRWF